MMKRTFYLFIILLAFASCQDDDTFSMSTGLKLDFEVDTLKLDTIFSRTASATYSFWVYNRNDEGIRLPRVRLSRGNQTGFRVNVDGVYLDNANGSVAQDLEVRRNDSILVFVELTAPETGQTDPALVEEDIVFSLESGTEQKMKLQAWAWNAVKLYSPVISKDSVIESATPIIIYGGLKVEEGATLTLRNTTLYFHESAGIDVYGSLKTEDCTLRGDRLDRMFDYLPYDRVSGQWKGIVLHEQSANNELVRTEIRNPENGIVCESAAADSTVSHLKMNACIIHNCRGMGLQSIQANVEVNDCQFTNAQGDCVNVTGGMMLINYCTLGQFYPYVGGRGAALRFSNEHPLMTLHCQGSILTGYDEDVLMGEQKDSLAFNYAFTNCLLRTPAVEDSTHFTGIIWESPKDSIEGKKHFVKIDEDNLDYDFHLDSLSTAQGLGCYR